MMSGENSGNEKVESCASSKNTVATIPPNMGFGEALERAQSAYLDCCFDEPVYGDETTEMDSRLAYIRQSVGNNPLLVDSVFQYCDEATLRTCQLVNHSWRELTLNHTKLNLKRASDDVLEQVLQNKENLKPFNTIRIIPNLPPILPVHWMSYSPNLTCLELYRVEFEHAAELYRIIFDYFPCMKKLKLVECSIKEAAEQSQETEDSEEEDFETTTPQLQELEIHIAHPRNDEFPTFLANLVVMVIPKLGNLKKLTWCNGFFLFILPLFESLTLGNIHLEYLHYDEFPGALESHTVIREYFRICGRSLQHIHVPVRPYPTSEECLHRIIQEEVASNKLRDLYLHWFDYNLYPQKDFTNLETIVVDLNLQHSFNFVSKFPNLKNIKINVDYYLLGADETPTFDKPIFQNIYVKRLQIVTESDCREPASVELWQKWYRVLQAFPNVNELKLVGNSTYFYVYESLKDARKLWPNLSRLELRLRLDCAKWSDVVANVARFFRDLEIFIANDIRTELDQHSIFPLLLLPKLRTVTLPRVKIPRDVYELLKTHVVSLVFSELTFDE